jgi:uncharacterized tellurite resistance protein B-like protein
MTPRDETSTLSPFEEILLSSSNYFGVSFLLLLAWIACCDGEASGDEVEHIRKFAGNSPDASRIDAILSIARGRNTEALQLACEIVRHDSDQEKAKALFTIFLNVAISDGLLRPSENHLIRFLADLLDLSPEKMNACFHELTGRPFPPAPDLSSGEWWKSRDSNKQRQSSEDSSKSKSSSSSGGKRTNAGFERLKALAMLGLDEGATAGEIKAAFRRLSQVHHPDRYASLGPEAIEAASASFRRIRDAYDYLTANA